jgi:hypothetical protein
MSFRSQRARVVLFMPPQTASPIAQGRVAALLYTEMHLGQAVADYRVT